jgi:hypothetical protein
LRPRFRRSGPMLDILYILGGVVIFVIFAAYAYSLRRI